MSGSISRGTLPQNFLDSVSAETNLPTPEPQYFFAQMALAGRLSLAALDAGADTVQQFLNIRGGGATAPQGLDSLARAADAYPGAITTVDQLFGLNKGDTIMMPRDIFEGGGYSKQARHLKTDGIISTVGQNIRNEEVPLVLEEYVGPYNVNTSRVDPYAIWTFDARYRANKVQLASKVSRHLKRDYVKWLDIVVRDTFLQSSNVTMPGNITDVTGFAPGGGVGISMEQIFAARAALTDREWAPFPNGRYMCLVPTTFNTQMLSDPDYRQLSKNSGRGDGQNLLFGAIGSIQNIDFFECTTLRHYSDNGGSHVAALNSATVGAGVIVDEALLIGPGAVGFGTALAPEGRWADDTNYGTVAKIIWYALHAIGMLDDRGVQRIPYQGTDG